MSELFPCHLLSSYSFIFSFLGASLLCTSMCLLGNRFFLVIYGSFPLIPLLCGNSEGEIFMVVCHVDL